MMDPKLVVVKAEIKSIFDEMLRVTDAFGETKEALDRLHLLKVQVDKLVNDYLAEQGTAGGLIMTPPGGPQEAAGVHPAGR
jgi:hypothetical protein